MLVHVRILVAVDNRLGDAAVKEERTGIQWDFNTVLEDLDSADDIALLSSTIMKHLQFKTSNQEDNSAQVGLKLNAKECKVLKVNSKSEASLNVGNCEVEVVDNVTKDGGGTADSRKRIAMANASFRRLENI